MKRNKSKSPLQPALRRGQRLQDVVQARRSDDRVPNDWLEGLAILLALVGVTGAGIALYHLSQQV